MWIDYSRVFKNKNKKQPSQDCSSSSEVQNDPLPKVNSLAALFTQFEHQIVVFSPLTLAQHTGPSVFTPQFKRLGAKNTQET